MLGGGHWTPDCARDGAQKSDIFSTQTKKNGVNCQRMMICPSELIMSFPVVRGSRRWFDVRIPPISLPSVSVQIQPMGCPNQARATIWEKKIPRQHRITCS